MADVQYPVVRGGYFHPNSDSMRCILLDRELSALNRRMYRQNRVYHGSIRVRPGGSSGSSVKVYTLAHSWGLANACRYAHAMYTHAMEDEFRLIRKPRWHDFRIAPFDTGADMSGIDASRAGLALWERNGDGYGNLQVDDYAYTRIHLPDQGTLGASDAVQFHALGPSRFTNIDGAGFASYGVLEEYNARDDVDQDTVAQEGGTYGAYAKLISGSSADATDENLAELATDGDLPPYDRDGLDAVRALKFVGEIETDAESMVLHFEAPLGMLFLQSSSDSTSNNCNVTVDLKPGSYKGVKAPMLYEPVKVLTHNSRGGHDVI